MVLVRSRSASPILNEGSGDQVGVRCCQGYSKSRIPFGGGCGRLRMKNLWRHRMVPSEIHASAMSKTGGKYKAANGTRIPNLGQQKVRFHNDEG